MDNNKAIQVSGPGALSLDSVDEFRKGFDADPAKRLVQNVVTQHDVNDVALSRSIVTDSPHSFSIVLVVQLVLARMTSGIIEASASIFPAPARWVLIRTLWQ